MTQAICLKSGLILRVAPNERIQIISVTSDEQTLDPIVIYRPVEGGLYTVMTMSAFAMKFQDAKIV